MKDQYFASCSQGLEPVIAKELKRFLKIDGQPHKGGLSFAATPEEAISFLLNTRIASRLFRLLDEFDFNDPNELSALIKKYAWNKMLNIDETFKIQVLFDRKAKDDLVNSIFIAQKIKDGIVDQYREITGGRPSVDKKNPDYPLLVRVEQSQNEDKLYHAQVYLDLCRGPLSNRGYRMPGHRAPLRENLAAGLLLMSDWIPSRDPIVDLFAGSGTLLIEAALIKGKIPPTYLKVRERSSVSQSFAFVKQKWFLKEKRLHDFLDAEIKKIHDAVRRSTLILKPGQIHGVERDQAAFDLAIETIDHAFIPRGIIKLSKGDAIETGPPTKNAGVIVSNPPYGERLNEDVMTELYYQLGENLKNNWNGWRAYLLTSNPELRKSISLRTEERIPIWNGNLECRLLKYALY